MQKNNMDLDKYFSPTSKTGRPNRIFYALLAITIIAFCASIYFSSSPLALISLGLTFWICLFYYMRSDTSFEKNALNSVITSSFIALNQILSGLKFKGTAIYLPPAFSADLNASKVYLKKDNKTNNLELEKLKQIAEKKSFFNDSEGLVFTPPGFELVSLIENQLDINFSKTNLEYVILNLPKLLIEDLALVKKFKITLRKNNVSIKIVDSTFKDAVMLPEKYSYVFHTIGCPLSSAIAVILSKVTGNPVVIENIRSSDQGSIVDVSYLIMEKSESEPIFPDVAKKTNARPIMAYKKSGKKNLRYDLLGSFLTLLGSIVLFYVGYVTFTDILQWEKDVATIFFGSRAGELISLNIDMRLIHVLLIGLFALLAGVFAFIRHKKRSFN